MFSQLRGRAKLDSLMTVLPKAAEDSNKLNLLLSISRGYSSIDTTESIRFGKQALALAEKLKNKDAVSFICFYLGNRYSQYGNYKESLRWFFKSLVIEKEKGDIETISSVLTNISVSYESLSDYSKALEYAFDGLR